MSSKNNKKKYIKFIIINLIIAFLILIFLILNEIFAIFKFNSVEKNIDIPYGSSVKKIAQILKENKVISNDFLFRMYLKIKGSRNIQNGNFTFKTNASYDHTINILKDVKKINNKINFYYGMDFFKFKEKYTKKESINIDDIIKNINKKEIYSQFSFTKELNQKNLDNCYFPMEGFVFDSTIPIFSNSTSESLAKDILASCDNFFAKVKEKTKSSNMSLWEIITLASIIQAETSNKEEMPRISSVFHNRLKIKKNLESDVTFLYYKKIEKDIKKNNSNIDLNKFKKYDTYKSKSLPPGPICTPSLDAIDAAIHPSNEEYYFFYSDEKTGKVSYAKDFETHKKNYLSSKKEPKK